MKRREDPQDEAERIPERLRWKNQPAFDPKDPEPYRAWKAEHDAWYEARGISKLDSLRQESGFERDGAA